MGTLGKVYRKLLGHFGKLGWWPAGRGFRPREWEVCLGAILTQNTSWKNVEKALDNLKREGILSPEEVTGTGKGKLEELVRPSGYFRQKADRLKIFSRFVLGFGSFREFRERVTREQLLGVKGIGPETADSILLYACNKPSFVVDLYTKRVFSRLGLLKEKDSYQKVKEFFEEGLPRDTDVYREFHALIVEHSKRFCRKRPACSGCPLERECLKDFPAE